MRSRRVDTPVQNIYPGSFFLAQRVLLTPPVVAVRLDLPLVVSFDRCRLQARVASPSRFVQLPFHSFDRAPQQRLRWNADKLRDGLPQTEGSTWSLTGRRRYPTRLKRLVTFGEEYRRRSGFARRDDTGTSSSWAIPAAHRRRCRADASPSIPERASAQCRCAISRSAGRRRRARAGGLQVGADSCRMTARFGWSTTKPAWRRHKGRCGVPSRVRRLPGRG